MHVGAGGGAGRAHQPYGLALPDRHARSRLEAAEVAVERVQAAGVGQLHETAVAGVDTGAHHHPVGGRQHRGAHRGGDVDPLVQPAGFFPGQLPEAEGRDHRIAGDRLGEGDGRRRGSRRRRSGGGRRRPQRRSGAGLGRPARRQGQGRGYGHDREGRGRPQEGLVDPGRGPRRYSQAFLGQGRLLAAKPTADGAIRGSAQEHTLGERSG